MTTYCGWIVLNSSCGDDEAKWGMKGNTAFDVGSLMPEIEAFNQSRSIKIHVREINVTWVLTVAGSTNRRATGWEPFLEFCQRLAVLMPGSYGLIHVQDDEDMRPEYEGRLGVWRIARGKVSEHVDSLLSPLCPVVED